MEISSFFEWSTLGTLTGAAAAASAVTQTLKSIGFLYKVPTQFLSYLISCTILLLATLFSGTPTPSTLAIVPLNAILVSLCSNGIYSVSQRISGGEIH